MPGVAVLRVHGHVLPAQYVQAWKQAVADMRRGAFRPVVDALAPLVDALPGFAPARAQLSYALLADGRYRLAREQALLAVAADPVEPEFGLQLVMLLRRFEEIAAIQRLVERVPWQAPRSAPLLVRLAAQLGPVGLFEEASQALAAAARLGPPSAQAMTLLGTVQMMSGDVASARGSLETALALSPVADPHADWLLSLQPQGGDVEATLRRLHRSLDATAPGSEAEAYAAYALHNVLHAAGRHDEAWTALERGHAARRALVRYDRAAQHALFDALQATAPHARAIQDGDGTATGLIFIVGMHRSGTSVLERMLGGHDAIADGGESYVFPAAMRFATDHPCRGVIDVAMVERARTADLAGAGALFRDYARWRAGPRRWLTEKLPSNFLHAGHILDALPEARILHMRRDPVDTCFSNLRTFFSGAAPYAEDQEDLADYYLRYAALMRHWHRVAPGRILDVDYAALVAEPEREVRRVADFCGLDFQPAMLDTAGRGGYAATASLASVRQGILRDRGGAWKPYEPHLQPLLRALAPARPG